MNIVGVALCIVAFVLVLPIMTPSGAWYAIFAWRFGRWFLLAAAGWTFGIWFTIRTAFELLQRTPWARTRIQERRH